MSDRRFEDTNILVYLFDGDSPAKRERAREILATGLVCHRKSGSPERTLQGLADRSRLATGGPYEA